jgi:hypothetical protein
MPNPIASPPQVAVSRTHHRAPAAALALAVFCRAQRRSDPERRNEHDGDADAEYSDFLPSVHGSALFLFLSWPADSRLLQRRP